MTSAAHPKATTGTKTAVNATSMPRINQWNRSRIDSKRRSCLYRYSATIRRMMGWVAARTSTARVMKKIGITVTEAT